VRAAISELSVQKECPSGRQKYSAADVARLFVDFWQDLSPTKSASEPCFAMSRKNTKFSARLVEAQPRETNALQRDGNCFRSPLLSKIDTPD
jgi:hypothetical protein